MNFTPAQGVTPDTEVTWKQPHYKLFLAVEGTSPGDTVTLGQPRSGELAKKFSAGSSAHTDPLPKSLNSSVELLWLFYPLGISNAKYSEVPL